MYLKPFSRTIENLIEEDKVFAQKKKGGSEMWKDFGLLRYRESEEYCGYVCCNCCLKLSKHDEATSGITHLDEHLQNCSKKKLSSVSSSSTATSTTSKIISHFNSKISLSVCRNVHRRNY